MTRYDNPMARAIPDPPTCRDCGVDIPPDHEPDLPYCDDCLLERDEPELGTGVRVRITESNHPFDACYGVIDGHRSFPSGRILWRVTSPTQRVHLGYFPPASLTPDNGGKPPVDPYTAQLGKDLLLAHRRTR